MSDYNISNKLNFSSINDFAKKMEKQEILRLTDANILESLSQPYQIRAVGYIRVSHPDQAKAEKASLGEQEVDIRKYVKDKGWEMGEIYRDGGKSGGKIVGRDDFERAIFDATQSKYDVLVGWTTDRLARNVEEMTDLRSKLRKHNVQVTSVKQALEVVDPRKLVIEDNELLKKALAYLLDWNAEVDKKKIGDRFKMGKIGKAKKGLIPVKVPYGMKKVVQFKNGDPKQKIENDVYIVELIPIIREIFDLYDKNSYGMRRIAEYLNIKGIPAPRGGKWCYSTIKYMLQNPTYTGLVRYGWKLSKTKESRTRLNNGHTGLIVPGQHKALISQEQFDRIQEKLKRRSLLGGRAIHSRGLLTGIMKCGRCGGPVYLSSFPNWLAYKKDKSLRNDHKRSAVYLCANYAQYGRSGCVRRYVLSQGKIENIVVNKIKELSNNKTTQDEFFKQMKKNKVKNTEKVIQSLEKAHKEIDKQRQRLKKAYLSGAFDLIEFNKDREKMDNEDGNILDKLQIEKTKYEKEKNTEQKTREAILALSDFEANWDSAEFSQRKDLLQTILEKVIVKNNNVEIIFRSTFESE